MNQLPLTVALVGFVLGFRHAFEPDHLAAVTTLATRQGSVRAAVRLGLAWGLGHTASVGAVALLVTAAGVRVPESLQPYADLVVGLLLITLGVTALARHALRHRVALDAAHREAHRHHVPHVHVRDARQSLGFGLAHGLAGSGAVVVLLVATAASNAARAAWFAAFGAGTVLGMLAVSAVVASLARAAAGRGPRWASWLHLGAAAASVVLGLLLGLESWSAL